MLSSKAILALNVLSLLFFIALIALQMVEIEKYTGSFFGFFQ